MSDVLKNLFSKQVSQERSGHLGLGDWGERAAVTYLEKYAGYEIVATNFRVPLGRGMRGQRLTAEIDIIAYDEGILAFIEVKTRTSSQTFAPEHSVGLRKQRQIARAARRYRQLMSVSDEPYRYDVVTVIPDGKNNRIELLRDYFNDGIFHRSRYFRIQDQRPR